MIERKCKITIKEMTNSFDISAHSEEDGTPPTYVSVWDRDWPSRFLVPQSISIPVKEIPNFVAALSKVAAEGHEVWGK